MDLKNFYKLFGIKSINRHTSSCEVCRPRGLSFFIGAPLRASWLAAVEFQGIPAA